VFHYDRRGRGDSGDTLPYAVEREVEDIAALLSEAGGAAFVWGTSSGAVLALEAADGGMIRRCHPHDPSWHNWPVIEHAVIDNIVPDFPLINKSFNLSYSGHDL